MVTLQQHFIDFLTENAANSNKNGIDNAKIREIISETHRYTQLCPSQVQHKNFGLANTGMMVHFYVLNKSIKHKYIAYGHNLYF